MELAEVGMKDVMVRGLDCAAVVHYNIVYEMNVERCGKKIICVCI